LVAQDWTITPKKHTVQFNSADASGIFEDLSGTIVFDTENLAASKFVLVIKVESISTGNFLKNSHAKGNDWFEADKYPAIKFISNQNGFSKTASGYEVTGYLQMHGINKLITIPFTFNKNTLNAKFSVDRTDYGIGKPDNDVEKTIKINAIIPIKKK
jgi:polyisoprenoid-binding protein YceI